LLPQRAYYGKASRSDRIMERILVLDDEQSVLDVLRDALTSMNYDAETVIDARAFFNSLQARKPDLVLIDYILADNNGGTICHQIKTNPETRGIPVILMSGYEDANDLSGLVGCDDFIKKPFSMEELAGKITACLGGKIGQVQE
jgi:DNA-binding response OmpR family regulator